MPVDGAVTKRKARRWLLLALLLLALGVAGYRWWRQPEAADDSVMQALSSVAMATQHAVMASQTPSAPAYGASAATELVAAPTGPIDPGCPPQWRALAGKPADAIDQVFRRLRPVALAHAGQLLASSPEAFERIAGRLLMARARDVEGPPDADTYLALVSEALSSNDPRVAALATQLCDTAPAEHAAACSSMSPARWAAVDPDNVQSWLAVAAEALERSDNRSAREALARAAQSRGSRLIWSDLMPLSNSAVLQALPPVERQVLAADLIGVGSLLVNNGLLAISRLCSTDALTAPQRLAG